METMTDKVINIGDEVVIDNDKHPYHQKRGRITSRDDHNYRVKFIQRSGSLWIPFEWVKPV